MICSTNYPNVHIHTFCEPWSFIVFKSLILGVPTAIGVDRGSIYSLVHGKHYLRMQQKTNMNFSYRLEVQKSFSIS